MTFFNITAHVRYSETQLTQWPEHLAHTNANILPVRVLLLLLFLLLLLLLQQ